MTKIRHWSIALLMAVFSLALLPGMALAADGQQGGTASGNQLFSVANIADQDEGSAKLLSRASSYAADPLREGSEELEAAKLADIAEAEKADKLLEYDRKLIKKIGTQQKTGHTICCPSFSCAYADAVLDGTVHDHSYYTCSCCTWTDWGGGNSSFRSLGSDEELLREAYGQIAKGKPTVIHVVGGTGEHWIALIGYQNVKDPDHLTLKNFIALDPWDGAQITASDRWSLYGDGCEHISDR